MDYLNFFNVVFLAPRLEATAEEGSKVTTYKEALPNQEHTTLKQYPEP